MKEKLKRWFLTIAEGTGTLTIFPDDERRLPLDGGGFAQDRRNLRCDVQSTAIDMKNAVQNIMHREAE